MAIYINDHAAKAPGPAAPGTVAPPPPEDIDVCAPMLQFAAEHLPGCLWVGVLGIEGEKGQVRPLWVWRRDDEGAAAPVPLPPIHALAAGGALRGGRRCQGGFPSQRDRAVAGGQQATVGRCGGGCVEPDKRSGGLVSCSADDQVAGITSRRGMIQLELDIHYSITNFIHLTEHGSGCQSASLHWHWQASSCQCCHSLRDPIKP